MAGLIVNKKEEKNSFAYPMDGYNGITYSAVSYIYFNVIE
jgi:hypothetical protein